VEQKNYLGIYISKQNATVVCIDSHGQKIVDCFSASVEQTQMSSLQQLTDLIAKGCTERKIPFSDVAIAVDCAMFMQHSIHSEFDDPKQIAATIRFDTEEALATEVSDVAIAFETTSTDQTGSNLAVFTAEEKILSELIISLQSNNIDPVTIEPDVNCLARFIRRNMPQTESVNPLYCLLSNSNGYFIAPPHQDSHTKSIMRTFLVSPNQNRAQLLVKQVPLTTVSLKQAEPVNCLKILDSLDSVNHQHARIKLVL